MSNLRILFIAFVLGIITTVMINAVESKPRRISFDVSHFKQIE